MCELVERRLPNPGANDLAGRASEHGHGSVPNVAATTPPLWSAGIVHHPKHAVSQARPASDHALRAIMSSIAEGHGSSTSQPAEPSETLWFGILGCAPSHIEPSLAAFTQRIHPDEQKGCVDIMAVGFGDGRPFVFNCRAMHHDGHWHWLQVRGKVAARTADGLPLRVAGVLVDVHARKLTEQALRVTLAENERLVGELRTALQNIKTLALLLKAH